MAASTFFKTLNSVMGRLGHSCRWYLATAGSTSITPAGKHMFAAPKLMSDTCYQDVHLSLTLENKDSEGLGTLQLKSTFR